MGFEITIDDIIIALGHQFLSEVEALFILNNLDSNTIAKQALYGNDLDKQTCYAHQCILEMVNEKQAQPVFYHLPSMQTTYVAYTLLEQISAKRMGGAKVNETVYAILRQACDAGHKVPSKDFKNNLSGALGT